MAPHPAWNRRSTSVSRPRLLTPSLPPEQEGGVERIIDLKTLGEEDLIALGLPQGCALRMLSTMETFKPEPNRGVVAPITDDVARDADDKAAMNAKLAAMLGAGHGAWHYVDSIYPNCHTPLQKPTVYGTRRI